MGVHFAKRTLKKRRGAILSFTGVDKAAVLYGLGRNTEALNAVERLLGNSPQNRDGMLLKAKILQDRGRARDALALVNRVLRRSPRDYEALLTKAMICPDVGRPDEGLRICSQLARRTNLPSEERRYLLWQWVSSLIACGRWQSARRTLRVALRQFPDDSVLLSYVPTVQAR